MGGEEIQDDYDLAFYCTVPRARVGSEEMKKDTDHENSPLKRMVAVSLNSCE